MYKINSFTSELAAFIVVFSKFPLTTLASSLQLDAVIEFIVCEIARPISENCATYDSSQKTSNVSGVYNGWCNI